MLLLSAFTLSYDFSLKLSLLVDIQLIVGFCISLDTASLHKELLIYCISLEFPISTLAGGLCAW